MVISSAALVASLTLLAAAPAAGNVPRVTAPASLAALQQEQSADAGYEGQVCTVGLMYGGTGDAIAGLPGVSQLFSTTGSRLRAAKRLGAVDDFLKTGRGKTAGVDEVTCIGAAFGHVADLGTVAHPAFDQVAITVGGFAQELCGPVEVVAIARKGDHYAVLQLPLAAASSRYTCDAREPSDEAACTRRDACVRAFLRDEQDAAAVRARAQDALSQIRFTR